MTMTPIAAPIGNTCTAPRSVTNLAASTAPIAMPTATTPCIIDACDRLSPSAR